ncbi:MAG: thiamine diphosphokinase [Dehalococcoidia bacterium]
MRTLIFANGDAPSRELVNQVHRRGDLVFAADGGARHALACGLVPDAVIGDLDSVDDEMREAIPEGRFHRVARLDITDLEKAVAFALARGSTAIEIVGASGGRSDHALANLSVLVTNKGAAAIRIHDELFEISLVDGSLTIDGPEGTVVSLVALGECTGVTTDGLRWPLEDFTLPFGPRGIHNEIASSPARVSVETGNLLLFKGRWIEKHA